MKLGKWGMVGLPVVGLASLVGVVGLTAVLGTACSSKSDNNNNNNGNDSGTPDAGATTLCTIPASGEFPLATCGVADNTGCVSTPGCSIAATCGDPATCLPMASNTGKDVLDFRFRRMNVQAPAALAQPFVQSAIVTKNIDLDAKQCSDSGNGAFNWLVRLDKKNNKLTSGGAPPSADPFNVGYCFYNAVLDDKVTNVQPVTVGMTQNADGTYNSEAMPLLNVPIFLNGDIKNVIVLPISDATFHSVGVSADGNCVGSFNSTALDSTCGDDPSTCEKWKTAGSLGGFITLEAADTVNVADLSESMCVLLTRSAKDPNTGKCKRDANNKIDFKGDYCSTSKKPGDCQDSYWLAATFAAAAIKVDESGTVAVCKPGAPPVDDAGADTGAPDTGTPDTGAPDTGIADAASE